MKSMTRFFPAEKPACRKPHQVLARRAIPHDVRLSRSGIGGELLGVEAPRYGQHDMG